MKQSYTRFPVLFAMAAVLVLLPVVASATPVRYDFTSIDIDSGDTWTFTYTAPDFITTAGWVNSFDDCTVNGVHNCIQLRFDPDGSKYPNADVIGVSTGYWLAYFYFDEGVLDTPGVHTSSVTLQSFRHSVLTVTTPEPGGIALLALGVVAMLMRRRVRG